MKKILYLVLISIISLGLIACGSNTDVAENIETTDVAEIEVNTNEDTIAEEVIEMEEPTSEINEEAVEEVIEEAEDTLVEEKVEEIVEENVSDETETTTYTYSDTSATMYAKSTVNVRDLPDQSGNKVGSLSQNQEVTVTGKCNETGWYRIDYNGSVAYVSNSFLVNEKVEVAPPAETNPPANTGGGKYTNEYGRSYTMTYEDVAAAFGQPIGVVIQDSDTSGHFYVIVSHIRGVSGSPIADIVSRISSEGWSSVSTTDNYAASYDNRNWEIQIGYCNR